jgi:hypothetical protein
MLSRMSRSSGFIFTKGELAPNINPVLVAKQRRF